MSVQEIRLANSAPARIAKIPFKGEEQPPVQTEEPSKQEGHGLLIGALATAAIGIAGIALYHKFNKKAAEEVGNAVGKAVEGASAEIKAKQAKLKELGEAHTEIVKRYQLADEAEQSVLNTRKSQIEYEINTLEEELSALEKKPAA